MLPNLEGVEFCLKNTPTSSQQSGIQFLWSFNLGIWVTDDDDCEISTDRCKNREVINLLPTPIQTRYAHNTLHSTHLPSPCKPGVVEVA